MTPDNMCISTTMSMSGLREVEKEGGEPLLVLIEPNSALFRELAWLL